MIKTPTEEHKKMAEGMSLRLMSRASYADRHVVIQRCDELGLIIRESVDKKTRLTSTAFEVDGDDATYENLVDALDAILAKRGTEAHAIL